MYISKLKAFSIALAIPILAACGTATEETPTTSTRVSAAQAATPISTAPTTSKEEPSAKIVESGFGQNESVARAMVVAESTNAEAVGQFVTASVNFLDETGSILATETQVEQFAWESQQIALPVTFYYGDQDVKPIVDSIEVSVSVSDHNLKAVIRPELPVLDAIEIQPRRGGGTKTAFEFNNEGEALDGLRVGSVCYNEEGQILGGDFAFPKAVPSSGKIRIEVDNSVVENPVACKAFLNYS